MYACIYIEKGCVCVYTYIYIYTHIYTHTHGGLVTESDSQNPMDWSQQGSSVPRIF